MFILDLRVIIYIKLFATKSLWSCYLAARPLKTLEADQKQDALQQNRALGNEKRNYFKKRVNLK